MTQAVGVFLPSKWYSCAVIGEHPLRNSAKWNDPLLTLLSQECAEKALPEAHPAWIHQNSFQVRPPKSKEEEVRVTWSNVERMRAHIYGFLCRWPQGHDPSQQEEKGRGKERLDKSLTANYIMHHKQSSFNVQCLNSTKLHTPFRCAQLSWLQTIGGWDWILF